VKRQNIAWWTLVVAVTVAVSVWALRPQPISVEMAEVVRGRFEQTIDDDGRTRVRDRYTVSAPLAGRVLRIALRAGDAVKRDAVVAVILPSVPVLQDPRTVRELEERSAAAEANVLRAEALEQRAVAALEQAKADALRSTRLAADGFVSPASSEQSDLAAKTKVRELEAARYERLAAEHELAQARAALLRVRADAKSGIGRAFEVRAPVSGRVPRVLHESEGPVAVGAGLVELGDVAILEVVVDVLSTEAVAIPVGADVHLDVGTAKTVLRGKVRRIEPSAFTKISALGVEEQRVNVVIDFAQAGDALATIGDGYRVDAKIVVHRTDQAVLVPTGALFREGAGFAVFVIEAGRVHKRPVDVPRRNNLAGLVAGGVRPGDKVVVFPGDTVRDGVRVSVRKP